MIERGDEAPQADRDLPAWSEPFRSDLRSRLERARPIEAISARSWLGSTGAGVTVAIVDSGVEGDHPAVGGRLVRSVRVELLGASSPPRAKARAPSSSRSKPS